MSIEFDTTHPLMPIALPKVNSLQKKSIPDFPSKIPKDPIIPDTMTEPEPKNFWETGTFIDLYI